MPMAGKLNKDRAPIEILIGRSWIVYIGGATEEISLKFVGGKNMKLLGCIFSFFIYD